MARELMEAVGRCDGDPAVRAVLLTGEGRRFCVGGDLREFVAYGDALPDHLREVTPTCTLPSRGWSGSRYQ